MRFRTSLFHVACFSFISMVGCGEAGINPLRNNEVSVYEGSYGGNYSGLHGEAGTMVVSIARDGSFLGTITDGIEDGMHTVSRRGPLTGVVRQDGHFKASFHYGNETTQYSGTGIMTPPVVIPASSTTTNGATTTTPAMRGFSGTWNLTSPTATTLQFSISGVTGQ